MAELRRQTPTLRTPTAALPRPARAALLAIAGVGLSLSGPMASGLAAGTASEAPVVAGVEQSLEYQQARPLALAAADFDEDGTPDLVTGYAMGARGLVTLHRGNVDALFPHSPGARRRRLEGAFTAAPFLPAPRSFTLPSVPDFLHTGDFDADGHSDVIAAARSGGALVMRGDGKGGLVRGQPLALPGAVTAMAVGDINEPDGLADLLIGITEKSGARLLVFAGRRGAWTSVPETFDLPSAATALAVGDLNGDHAPDVAVAAGSELLVVHRQTTRAPASRASAAPVRIERRSLPFGVAAMRAGHFNADRQADLSLTADAGDTTRLLSRRTEPDARAAAAPGLAEWTLVNGNAAPEPAGATMLAIRLDRDGRDDHVTIVPGASIPAAALTLTASTLVVVNTNDSGEGSLRQAILNANANPGDDLITFDIPGPAPHTIVPLTPLPPILSEPGDEGTVIIDGTSEPGFAGTPVIEVSGAIVGAAGSGLLIHMNGAVVRGLVINRFASGIAFTSSEGPGVQSGFVEGNYLGTDITGTAALGNGAGVSVGLDATGVTVGGTVPAARNVVSGNTIGVAGGGFTARNTVQGNFIGTDATGTADLGNVQHGVDMSSGAFYVVGGPAPGARNIISGNGIFGVILTDSGSNLVSGNFVGTDVTGMKAIGNDGVGIDVPEGGAIITDNLVSANGRHGIAGTTSSVLDVRRNRVGTNRDGTAALGNAGNGINYSGIGHLTIDNLVSGNGGHGIFMGGMSHTIQGNRIGTDVTGTLALGNRGSGVYMEDIDNRVGGTDEGAGNIIAFNGGNGITVATFFATDISNNALLSNAIFSNERLGIDLGNDGVTPNDSCDPDTGGNDLQNFPVIAGVSGSASSITIQGQLNSKPDTSYLLQFFASAVADPSGFGEGARFLGATTVTTDAACNVSFTSTLPVAVAPGHVVTATATDPIGSTSEFSNAQLFVPQTAQEATRRLIDQVRQLVAQGELNGLAGFVLTIKLRAAIFFIDRDRPLLAAQQLRGFIALVEGLVRFGELEPAAGQALIEAARGVLALLAPS